MWIGCMKRQSLVFDNHFLKNSFNIIDLRNFRPSDIVGSEHQEDMKIIFGLFGLLQNSNTFVLKPTQFSRPFSLKGFKFGNKHSFARNITKFQYI
jgi:hypothetical protein